MRRLTRVLWVCSTLLLSTGCGSPYLLTVEDRVCRAGDDVKLIGKLEFKGVGIVNKGLEDRDLSFHLDGRFLDTDDTNDDGYAKVRHDFDNPGVHRLVVAYDEDGDQRAESAAAVFVWREQDPILVVDIDDTVARTKRRYLVLPSPDRSPPMEGAAEVLRSLSRSFHVVYLTGRPRELLLKTRQWLQRNGFPPGPVLTWDVDKDPWSQADYKKHRIDDLQDDFDAVTIGIGNEESDHKSYRKRKLFSIILDPGEPPRRIKRGVRLPDWEAVRDFLARNPKLYDKDLSYKTDVRLPVWTGDD